MKENHSTIQWILEKIANCCYLLKEYSLARNYAKKTIRSLEAIPNHSPLQKTIRFRIYIRLGNLYIEDNNLDSAINCYSKVLPIPDASTDLPIDEKFMNILVKCIRARNPSAKKAKENKNYQNALTQFKIQLVLIEIYMRQSKESCTFILGDYVCAVKSIGMIYIKEENYQLAYSFMKNSIREVEKNVIQNYSETMQRHLAVIYSNMGIVCEKVEKLHEALTYYHKSLKIKKRIFNGTKESSKISKTSFNVAYVHHLLDQDKLALYFFREGVQLFKIQNNSKADFETFTSVYEFISRICEKYFEMEDALVFMTKKIKLTQSSEWQYPSIDSYQTDIANCHHRIAILFGKNKKYDQCVKNHFKALELRQNLYLENDEDSVAKNSLLQTFSCLASVYGKTNSLDGALKYYDYCLKFTNSFDAVYIYNAIGIMHFKMNKQNLALEFYAKALHAESLNANLCKCKKCRDLRKDLEALDYYKSGLELKPATKEILEGENTSVLEHSKSNFILYEIGVVHLDNQQYNEAIKIFLRFLEWKRIYHTASEKVFLDEYYFASIRKVSALLCNIGNIKFDQGLYNQSINFFSRSLALKKEFSGNNNPKLEYVASNLGCAFYYSKDYNAAIELFESTLKELKSKLNQIPIKNVQQISYVNLRISDIHNRIGNIYTKRRQYDLALLEYQKGIRVRVQLYKNKNHPQILTLKHNIALLNAKTGQLDLAMNQLQEILEQKAKWVGKDDPILAKINLDLSAAFLSKKDFSKAKTLCEESIQDFRSAKFPENHVYVKQAQRILKESRTGNFMTHLETKKSVRRHASLRFFTRERIGSM